MNKIVKTVVITCFAVLLCLAGYRVYDKTSTGAVERHEGVQIGQLYLNAAASEKNNRKTSVVSADEGSLQGKQQEVQLAFELQPVEIQAEKAVADNLRADNTVTALSVSSDSSDIPDGELQQETQQAQTEQTDSTEEDDGITYVDPKVKSAEFYSRTRYLDGSFEICWYPVRDAVAYKVYGIKVNSDGSIDEKVLIDRVEDTRYIINDIETSAVYHYGVKPVFDGDPKKATLKRIDLCKPEEISEIRTNRISDTSVNIKWTASRGASGYKISYRTLNGYFKDLTEVNTNSLNADIKIDKDYIFRVVPFYDNGFTRIRTEGSALAKYYNRSGDVVSLDHQKYTSAECYEDIEMLMMRYSDIMKTSVLGLSERGREIIDITIGNEDSDSALLVVCEIHAREYITTAVMMRIVEYYLQNYYGTLDNTKVSDLLRKICIHFVVMANPDGLEISQNLLPRWKANADGINVNANFPYNFRSSGNRLEGTYTGDSAASSKEAQVIVDITGRLSEKYRNFGVLSYHAMGQIVFGSYKEENEVLQEKITEMYDIVIDSTKYEDAGKLDGGKAYGNYREYLIYEVGVPAITIEMGATVCPCDVSDYSTTFTKNKFVPFRIAAAISEWKQEGTGSE